MKRLALQLVLALACGDLRAQGGTTIRVTTKLVVVNAVAMKVGSSVPDGSLNRDDFEVFDNGRKVAIKTFDKGGEARPLVVWFLAQCPMAGWRDQGSGIFAGQTDLLRPALTALTAQDRVGVAHWCDDGAARVDLAPASNRNEAMESLQELLGKANAVPSHDRSGELALQAAIQQIVDNTRALNSDYVPIIVFIYDDFSAMPRKEADHFIDELLKSAATVYGLRDRRGPHLWNSTWLGGEKSEIAAYFAAQTGGVYVTADPGGYADGLRRIFDEAHARYELGFVPGNPDGKRHSLRVRLTAAAKQRHGDLTIRYRSGYVATREER